MVSEQARRFQHLPYKWIALSNTTLGVLMAALNGSIVLIALPAIFRGIGIDPLAPGETSYLLWALMGYLVVTAVLLVTCGRISDMFGRVRLYNLGFLIFTLGSVLLFFIQGHGNAAATQLIGFRVVQGIGGAFLMANSAAILTDAFPPTERGMAMGINQVALLAGSFLGLLIGGVLATIAWRFVFLVSVPFGLLGTVWAYLALHETAPPRRAQRVDVLGNLLFAGGLTLILVAQTYGLQPYGGSKMGWTNPWVVGGLALGIALLVAFGFVEARTPDPMFRLSLFRRRVFAIGNLSLFLASLARGGLQFILIIWLQGIWLPLHGYRFDETPLWAGIYMLPLTAGFLITGPVSGYLSDRLGSRGFTFGGMMVAGLAFLGLMRLPANFDYRPFAVLLFMQGVGMGMFAAPNTTAIMNAVPAAERGVSSGMRATFQNTANTLSIGLIFSLVVAGLGATLPAAMTHGLVTAGLPVGVASSIANVPPTGALFAAFLGYNPMAALLPPSVQVGLPAATVHGLLGQTTFPTLISGPFLYGMTIAFGFSAAVSFLAAGASLLRGGRYVHEERAPEPVFAMAAPGEAPVRPRAVILTSLGLPTETCRQYSEAIAKRLGWRLLDGELVEAIARELDRPAHEIATLDEEPVSSRILEGCVGLEGSLDGTPAPVETRHRHRALHEAIRREVAQGNVVLVVHGLAARHPWTDDPRIVSVGLTRGERHGALPGMMTFDVDRMGAPLVAELVAIAVRVQGATQVKPGQP